METRNFDHYMKVRAARRWAGLPTDPPGPKNGRIANHPLIGRKLDRGGKIYTIEGVNKHWMWGHYLGLLLNNGNDSHVFIFWENINCGDELVLQQIGESRQAYKLIDNLSAA